MKAANIFQRPSRQWHFQLCPCKFSFGQWDSQQQEQQHFLCKRFCTEKWSFTIHLGDFLHQKNPGRKVWLAQRGEIIPCESSFPPPCITWVQGGADTGGSVAQPRRFTLHTPLEVLLTGDAGQILNICHGSELLRDVLTVRIATSCTRSWNLNQGSWNFNFVQSYLADWNGGRCSLWNFPQESWEAQNHHPQESCRGRKG